MVSQIIGQINGRPLIGDDGSGKSSNQEDFSGEKIIRLILNSSEIDPYVIEESSVSAVRLGSVENAACLEESLIELARRGQTYSVHHSEAKGTPYVILRRAA